MVSAPPSACSSMRSTSLRSMATMPTLRKSCVRGPLAPIWRLSAPALPVKSSVSVPVPPSTVSLPSPSFHTN